MRFLVPRRERLAADAVERAYLAGLDEIPWRTRTQWVDGGLAAQRSESDSGSFYIPCSIEGHGELMLSTASLMERQRPYHLHVELARGTVNRLRNQMSTWELAGVAIPAEVLAGNSAAREHLCWAATRQEDLDAAADRALLAVRAALDAMTRLSDAYVEQALTARHQQAGRINEILGVNLGSTCPNEPMTAHLAGVFNTAIVPFSWRDIEAREDKQDWTRSDQQVEWCRANGLKICGGPLLQIDKWSLPDWMYLWGGDDQEGFRSCVVEHVQSVVTRYRGKVHLWQCASRLNIEDDFKHGEEERLRLAVLAIETIRRVDPRTPIVLLIDQPWGSFMSREDYDLSPWHFADALVRADLGLAGIGLVINFGFKGGGTEPRDAVEFGRQMDRWSVLGLPILVTLATASTASKDPQAGGAAVPVRYVESEELSPSAQRAWAERFLSVLLVKQAVQGIIWNQLTDSQPHEFPNAGLFDAHDRPKPILETFRNLRQAHLA